MRIRVSALKRMIVEAFEDELRDEYNTVEAGDVVDVVGSEVDYPGVRVLRLVDDVERETGVPHDPSNPHDEGFFGPGFIGRTQEGDELVFPFSHVVPGSKARGYFPKLGDENDEDEYGRPVKNPYRHSAIRLGRAAAAGRGDYLPYDNDHFD